MLVQFEHDYAVLVWLSGLKAADTLIYILRIGVRVVWFIEAVHIHPQPWHQFYE